MAYLLIFLAKQRHPSHIPNDKLVDKIKNEYGLFKSTISPEIKSIRDLITKLRNSTAHFDLECLSLPEDSKTIDRVQFMDIENNHSLIIEFDSSELLSFTKKIAEKIISNLDEHKYNN